MRRATMASWLLAAGVTLAASAAGANPSGIEGYRWRSRLLVVLAPDAADPRLAEQRRIFAASRAGMRERDLAWIERSGPATADLARRLGVPEGEFRSVLVGKDGGAKLVSAEPIPAERLFAEIDGMPMRQDEMRRGARAQKGTRP